MFFPTLSLIVVGLYCTRQTFAKTAAEWSELSIYQLITDRFALTDGSFPECDLSEYCGGTWAGIENNLDYIQGMGFDAVWISPVVHNLEGETYSGYAYHGYWSDDPFTLNQHFGTADDLTSLSNAIHGRNMSLMLDVVINHLASNEDSDSVDYASYPSPFNIASSFHTPCPTDYDNQTSIEYCWLIASPPPSLPDIDTENSTVLNSMIQSVVTLVETYNIDGIRLDTVKELPKTVLSQFQEAVGVFVTGEVYDDRIDYTAGYQGSIDSLVNYPLYWPLSSAFNATNLTSFEVLAENINGEEYFFSDINVLANFLDNHDQPRFASVSSDIVRDYSAITFLMFESGIPVTFYGFEQRFTGLEDPQNRGGLWWSGYNTTTPLYKYIAKLHRIRALVKENDADFFQTNHTVISTSASYIALERGPLMLVVSNVGAKTPDNGYAVPSSQFGEGTELMDLTSCQSTTTTDGGAFESAGNGGFPRIWVDSTTFSNGMTVCADKTPV